MDEKRKVIILFGVCGCGKSTIGQTLSTSSGWIFLDADDFHSEENIQKMKKGIPLDDNDRFPWLKNINNELRNSKKTTVIGCSALKKKYRELLVEGLGNSIFVFLEVSKENIKNRLKKRSGHFFNEKLLDSQFETLELPLGNENVVHIDASQKIEKVCEDILEKILI